MASDTDRSLVSIIIPCFNSEHWVRETIESCLNQTYLNIEIIVVDDGSTDGSVEVIRRYLPRVRLETGPNRGGNHARNKGFAISKGDFIQYLDADDYLAADKIARQVQFLEETNADVVYGDLRYRRHLPDVGLSYLDRTEVSGHQPDIIEALLAFWGARVNGGAVLYRRHAIDRVGGWDETLRAAQDTDFLTSVALSGARILYQPGSQFIYRKYGDVTVSTSSLNRWLESMCQSRAKSESVLISSGRLTDEYKMALAVGYFESARACYSLDPRSSFAIYARTLGGLTRKILDLSPHFMAPESRTFVATQRILGLSIAMHVFFRLRAAINIVRSRLKRNKFLFALVLRVRGVKIEREIDRRAAAS